MHRYTPSQLLLVNHTLQLSSSPKIEKWYHYPLDMGENRSLHLVLHSMPNRDFSIIKPRSGFRAKDGFVRLGVTYPTSYCMHWPKIQDISACTKT